ncbi:MAG: alpha/beta hydrolase [Chloroflexi bacterium]|nr:alpha/beta hydrolase [Chloroflexota bacterium]MCY4247196.1 alpha/beta hydrolase [Chloroflexota bacterium]
MRLFRRRSIRIVLIVALLLVSALVGALVYFGTPSGEVMPEALAALESTAAVQVARGGWITFMPVAQQPDAGFIFYPGGRVAAEAYAPLGRALAQAGYLAVITPMPMNLAILNIDAAGAVINTHPQIKRWVIGGHSLGGAMASRYAHSNPQQIAGLAILAAYPEAQIDFSQRDLAVASIYGELDGLATAAEIEASFSLLPADAMTVRIAGGNHAQFGWYGEQAGDNPAQISHQQQHEQVVQAVRRLLETSGA